MSKDSALRSASSPELGGEDQGDLEEEGRKHTALLMLHTDVSPCALTRKLLVTPAPCCANFKEVRRLFGVWLDIVVKHSQVPKVGNSSSRGGGLQKKHDHEGGAPWLG